MSVGACGPAESRTDCRTAVMPSNNASFGLITRTPDPNITRPYNVEMTLSAQRELMPGVSVSVGYFHRHYYNFIYTDNTALDVQDAFTPVSVPNPCYTGTVQCGGAQPQTLTLYKNQSVAHRQGRAGDRSQLVEQLSRV